MLLSLLTQSRPHRNPKAQLHADRGTMMTGRKKGPAALKFGRLISDRRRELRLSQQEVADRAGIHRTLLSDYERDGAPERVPSDDTLYGLAKALDVPVEQMFDWAQVRYPMVEIAVAKDAPPELVAKLASLEEAVRLLTERLEQFATPPEPQVARRPRRRPTS
jgi:transcriptional regulator with XRE-family HTH domain